MTDAFGDGEMFGLGVLYWLNTAYRVAGLWTKGIAGAMRAFLTY